MEPIKDLDNKFAGVLQELISTRSALNMPPEPMENPIGEGIYLSECDVMVNHAMEHLTEAINYAMEADREFLVFKGKIKNLILALPTIDKKEIFKFLDDIVYPNCNKFSDEQLDKLFQKETKNEN